MIAFDTNALIRMLIEDDPNQAKIVRELITQVENNSGQILILAEVLIETVWVLESSYKCTREEISGFLETLAGTPLFATTEPSVLRSAISQYKRGGDFADLVIVFQAKHLKANKLISFDKKLQKKFPDYVVESLGSPIKRPLVKE
jgi:predicted nucleic-acid-binding protein